MASHDMVLESHWCPAPRAGREGAVTLYIVQTPCSCTGRDAPSFGRDASCSCSPAPVVQASGKRGAVPAKESLRARVSSCTGRPTGSGSGSAGPEPSCEVWLTYTTMMSPLKFITCPLEMNVELLFPVTFPAGDRAQRNCIRDYS